MGVPGGVGGSVPGSGHAAMTGMILVTVLSTRLSGARALLRYSGFVIRAEFLAVVGLGLRSPAHTATTYRPNRCGQHSSACRPVVSIASMLVTVLTPP